MAKKHKSTSTLDSSRSTALIDDLRKYFLNERARFAAKYPIVGSVGLVITEKKCLTEPFCAPRDLAWCDLDKNYIYLTDRVLGLAPENIVGIIRHELGHMADPTPDKANGEQRADDIAEEVTGDRINYDVRDIQTVAVGKYPRPTYLHR